MSDETLAAYIVASWVRDVAPAAIMMHLICLGRPVTKAEVMSVIRSYIDQTTENRKQTNG